MANPQKGNGYTPIANEILEHLYKLKLNGTQFRIIMSVWRFTYGFSRKQHEMSESFIAEATGTHIKQISRELSSLIDMNIIKVIKDASFKNSRIISFNKNYDTWVLKDGEGANQLPPSGLDGETGSGLVTLPGSGLAPQDKQYIKQNIKQRAPVKKSDKKSYYPLDEKLNDTFWDFIDFRKKIKSPMTEHAIDLLIKKLDKMSSDNDEKIEILNQSIINGWKGIFSLKQDNRGRQRQSQDNFTKTMEDWLNESTGICKHSGNN